MKEKIRMEFEYLLVIEKMCVNEKILTERKKEKRKKRRTEMAHKVINQSKKRMREQGREVLVVFQKAMVDVNKKKKKK
jgi:hypothetical protein